MFAIKVEMWSQVAEDEFDLEYCGEFLWSVGFATGETVLFPTARNALEFLSEYSKDSSIPGFEYRYRIQPVDNFDGAFTRDANSWE